MGTDYAATAGSVTLPPGSLPGAVSVPIVADVLDELDETFTATVTADFASMPDRRGPRPRSTTTTVRASASRTAAWPSRPPAAAITSFDVSLTASSPQPVTVTFTTADGTAVAGADYGPANGSLTFAPGATAATVDVIVLGDGLDEPNETFAVMLQDVVEGRLDDPAATGFIVDADGGTFQLEGDLAHGTQRTAALAPAPGPPATSTCSQRPARSSWEIVVDAASGDLGVGNGPSLTRLAADLSTVLQGSTAAGTGQVRRLAIVNALATPVTDYVAVESVGCSTDCGSGRRLPHHRPRDDALRDPLQQRRRPEHHRGPAGPRPTRP